MHWYILIRMMCINWTLHFVVCANEQFMYIIHITVFSMRDNNFVKITKINFLVKSDHVWR